MVNYDVVIAGISGRFPESANVEEFKQNLFEGVDMVTEDDRRWPKDLLNMPTQLGSIKDLASFDATFFGIHAMQTNAMDPQLRILLEATHEAIIDAGVNPGDLRGSNTGVYIGNSGLETADLWNTNPEVANGYCITGTSRCMFSNRISYNFDLRGPSLFIDTACSSSVSALHYAFQAIKAGECDAAIVGGVNLNFSLTNYLLCHSLNILSPEGKCKVFDAECNGYVRSDAVVVVFLQKSENAKRIYANVINTKINTDGYKNLGITYPSSFMQHQLLKQCYDEAGIDPKDVSYIEAHGSGTPVGDPQEVDAISKLFCENRQDSLYIGSVKSNMGHSEGACGLCSIVKVIIAMETGVIPANLHFKNPNPNIPAIINGKIKVVDEPLIWRNNLVGVNSFGFGGTNAHVILKPNTKLKQEPNLEDYIEKVVAVSGCTKDACKMLLNRVKENKDNNEFISLVHNIHRKNITGHNYRGYAVLGKADILEIEHFQSNQEKIPLWFVFSGMGSQWSGMGKDLLKIKAFEMSLRSCAQILKPKGVNLIELFLNCKKETFDNVINSLVMITSFQIGLVDVLRTIGIKPDGLVGISVGELACAYADGSLSLEQTILSAYWRGKCIEETELEPGAMAVVSLSWKETAEICPPGVHLALNIAFDRVTVSGLESRITKFVKTLEAKGILAKVIDSSGVAFHSEHMNKAGPRLLAELEKVIPDPKYRSSNWLSSTVPESDWDTHAAKVSSPEYFVNNLLHPVLFYESTRHIPHNAIIIEIGPQCSLQTIMSKSFAGTFTYIGLHKKYHINNTEFLLSSIGQLYNAGKQPDLSKLYPLVQFPVSRNTPMLNSVIGWDHETKWFVPDYYNTCMSNMSQQRILKIDISKDDYKYLATHSIGGRVIFPATGLLVLVWETFAKQKNISYEKLSIVFTNVIFLRSTDLLKEGGVQFTINILPNGDFEVCEGEFSVVTGNIKTNNESISQQRTSPNIRNNVSKQTDILYTNDFYKELRLRGYMYPEIFQGVKLWNNNLKTGQLYWMNNWVTFLDTIIQVQYVENIDSRKSYIPSRLQYLAINPIQHLLYGTSLDHLIVDLQPNIKMAKSGAVEMRGLKFSMAKTCQKSETLLKLESYNFVPYDKIHINATNEKQTEEEIMTIFLQTIVESIPLMKLRGIEIFTSEKELFGSLVLDIFNDEPLVFCDYRIAIPRSNDYGTQINDVKTISHDFSFKPVANRVHLIIANNILSNNNSVIMSNLVDSLTHNGFIILVETEKIDTSLFEDCAIILVAKHTTFKKSYFLLKRKEVQIEPTIIHVTTKDYKWIEEVQFAMANNQNALLISQGESKSGIIGFANSIRKESEAGLKIHYVYIQDDKAPKFSLTDPFYSIQLKKQLFANVLIDNEWGSYRHLKRDPSYLTKVTQLEHAYVNTLIQGRLSSLSWIQSPPINRKLENISTKENYSVYYAPLNVNDVMTATGKIVTDAVKCTLGEKDSMLGLEFAGKDGGGTRVMGMVPANGLATTVLIEPDSFVWKVPQKWTLAEAATIPVSYVSSYYALIVRGKLQKGESVLIHSGADGVGLASIHIAVKYCCTIFTTVNTEEKREFIKKTFPQITDKNIGNSNDTSFEQLILDETNGHGVDIVLNSLSGDKLNASVRCLAAKGRFLEIGVLNPFTNNMFGIDLLFHTATFHFLQLTDLFQNNSTEKNQVINLVKSGLSNGEILPLPATMFRVDQIEEGFRCVANGEHIGKVIIKIRDEEIRDVEKQSVGTVAGVARTYMDPEKCYILVGGLGGLGLELADWIISRGAKYIVLTSRSGIKTGYQSFCINRWKKAGTQVTISTEDVSTIENTKKLLSNSSKLAPIGGIFNLAAVLDDGLLEHLNVINFEVPTKIKVYGTSNLDLVSRKYCPNLDFFVVMSSVASRGVPGQSNYALANSFMERLVEQRRAAGFPGLAIQWGPIDDVGMVIDAIGINNDVVLGGYVLQSISSCLDTIDFFLQNEFSSVVSSYILEDKKKYYGDNLPKISLVRKLADIMGIKNVENINLSSTLVELGLDSLISAEIKQTFERFYDIIMDPIDIRALTFSKTIELQKNAMVVDF